MSASPHMGGKVPHLEDPPAVAVVGAGAAGLAAARRLTWAGAKVTVFDKGRGVGGRCSVRRVSGWSFDHGVQSLAVRDPRFGEQLRGWLDGGMIARWSPRLVEIADGRRRVSRSRIQRFVGVPGMNRAVASLAVGLDIRSATKVTHIMRVRGAWRLTHSDGTGAGPFDAVLVAVPPEQAVPLLDSAPGLAKRAAAARVEPSWCVMLGFDEHLDTDFDAALVHEGPLEWVARDSSKPERPAREAWVLHASAAWSAAHLEEEPAHALTHLAGAFAMIIGRSLPEPTVALAHRWRYARPIRTIDPRCEAEHARGAFIAGDWCRGPSLEAAWLSGVEASERIAERLELVSASGCV